MELIRCAHCPQVYGDVQDEAVSFDDRTVRVETQRGKVLLRWEDGKPV